MPVLKHLKRLTAVMLFLAIIMSMALADEAHVAPSGTAETTEWTFGHGITIVCPWGEGGGADSTIRSMSSLLEEYLGGAC